MLISLSQHSDQIAKIIDLHSYQKVALQIPKACLNQSFKLTCQLRKKCLSDNVQFYTLYDSLKNQCCTDILGAKHIDYDALFHFGYACFSEQYKAHHYYLLPEYNWANLQKNLQEIRQEIITNNIDVVICDQSIYRKMSKFDKWFEQIKTKNGNPELGRLPFDKNNSDSYFGFSYYINPINESSPKNVLVIKPTTDETANQQNPSNIELIQNIYLCRKALNVSRLYTFSLDSGFSEFEGNINKKIMQRLSQINELQKYTTFGILVSNPSTLFCQNAIIKCKRLLEAKGLKHFTFMMNNLNQCKLGNFPQIQVYVVISCYNHSLYNMKDFYRLVVTPFDLEIAFQERGYEDYNFDLVCQLNKSSEGGNQQEKHMNQEAEKQEKVEISSSLTKVNSELAVQQMIQTLDFYRHKQYKGLDFSESKQIQKIKKGKIGIAEQYRPLESQQK